MIVAHSRFDEKGLHSHFFHGLRISNAVLGLLWIGCGLGSLFLDRTHLPENVSGWLQLLESFGFILGGTAFLLRWKIDLKSSKRSVRRNPFYGKDVTWRFDSDGYELREEDRDGRSKKFTWKEVKRIDKSSKGVLIYLKEKLSLDSFGRICIARRIPSAEH